LVKLNLVVEGIGTVWIKDIELVRGPMPDDGQHAISRALQWLRGDASTSEKSPQVPTAEATSAMLRTREGFYVRAVGGGGDDVVADVREPKSSERFTLEWLAPNQSKVRIRTRDGFYLHAVQGGGGNLDARVKEPRTSEEFAVEWVDREFLRLRLKSREGFYVRAVRGGGGDVTADRREPGTSEVFTLVDQDDRRQAADAAAKP
jgi:hypothetical protein